MANCFKPERIVNIDELIVLVRCGAVQNRQPGRGRTTVQRQADTSAGAKQAAEKLIRAVGRGFIPGVSGNKSTGPLGPEVCFSQFPIGTKPFSAACLAPAKFIARRILFCRIFRAENF